MIAPYFSARGGAIKLWLADSRDVFPALAQEADVLVMDPPYGIAYESGKTGQDGGTALQGIVGDLDTSLRDGVLASWLPRPAIVFGSWKRPRPLGTRAVLVWDKGDHVGMGDLRTPWKPNTEEVYILGKGGFSGRRTSSVLRFNAPVSWNSAAGNRREHPHEKPLSLMLELVAKCDGARVIDPFCGTGTTGIACARLGKGFVGVEVSEAYCGIAAKRIRDEVASPGLLGFYRDGVGNTNVEKEEGQSWAKSRT